jgi:hypothetical protein
MAEGVGSGGHSPREWAQPSAEASLPNVASKKSARGRLS